MVVISAFQADCVGSIPTNRKLFIFQIKSVGSNLINCIDELVT